MTIPEQHTPSSPPTWLQRHLIGLLASISGVVLLSGLLRLAAGLQHIGNVSMLYLLVVMAVALRFGSGPAVLAAILSFLAFDFLFVEPRYTFTVADPAEWLALFLFLVVATVTGQLTAMLQARAEMARRREREAAALAEASWAIASQVSPGSALSEVLRRLAEIIEPEAAAVLTLSDGAPPQVAAFWGARERLPDFAAEQDHGAVEFVFKNGTPIAWDHDDRHWQKALRATGQAAASYLPLSIEHRVLGVLYLQWRMAHAVSTEARRVIQSLANHAAVVLERERLSRAETATQALAAADRLKTALLSMVSHDFRSPLASIKASVTGLLQEGAPWAPEIQRELLQGIDHETDRLNRMVGNILALSRLEADAWRPQYEAIAPAELVGVALSALSPRENERIEVSLIPDMGELWIDPVQIAQVLQNLVDNALKYSPPGTPVELRLSTGHESTIIEVLDRGRGLSLGEEERVFEPFYRAADLQESALPGVGLGLAVCRGLVEAHRGELTAAGREGGGACFRVRLPLEAGDVRHGGDSR